MDKTFLICSLYDRTQDVIKLLVSLRDYRDWNVDIVLQQYPGKEKEEIKTCAKAIFNKVRVFSTNEMTGPHLARCIALDSHMSDVWCILDDDMYAVSGYTDYNTMAEIVYTRKDIGLLSSNWRKQENMLKNVSINNILVRQNIVYTGGGMMFRQDVADIIKSIKRVQYLFDNPLWSIYSYVNGYDNYRYMGSASVHKICTKGGRRKWIKESDKTRALPPSEWIKTRRGKGEKNGFDEYLICNSSDITSLAHELHKRNKK